VPAPAPAGKRSGQYTCLIEDRRRCYDPAGHFPGPREVALFRRFGRSPQGEDKTTEALDQTRRTWFRRVTSLFERSRIDDQLWDELEELLIASDVGVATVSALLEGLQARARDEGMKQPDQVRQALREQLARILVVDSGERLPSGGRGQLWGEDGGTSIARPAIILVVGVNGTGKTTSIAKLAWCFKSEGKRVILAAADTFRAAAIDQLRQWGERVGAEVIAHREGADPGAVVFDALRAAEARSADIVVIDTAGRLHTKVNLMEELRKIQRVVQRKDPSAPHEVLLVLDATTGQNAVLQASHFTEAVPVTGILLAKLDGTAKGGIVFAICDQLGIPVRFVGTGENPEDLAPFSADEFVDALFA
jgi:fused signal recognition particle receptor